MQTNRLTIGTKYLFNGAPTNNIPPTNHALIFIGMINDRLGRFILDDQAVFDILKQPFNAEVLSDYLHTQTVKTIDKVFTVITHDISDRDGANLWLSNDQLTQAFRDNKALLRKQERQLKSLRSPAFYATDCPNGETYQAFINEFKARCKTNGLDISQYTYHGHDGHNILSVSNNGVEADEALDINQTEIFFNLKDEPQFERLSLHYCASTTIPKLHGA